MSEQTMTSDQWPIRAPDTQLTGSLAGVRVIDLCVAGPGPFCTLILAGYGADVIHVSRTGAPDPTTDSSHQNCGKRSIRVDLKKQQGKAIIKRLAAHADVFIEGFRPGVMERLGLSPDVLREINPRLIYVRMTGWGQTGPYARQPGHDINYIAISGALAVIGPEQPTPPMMFLGDYSGGSLVAAVNILTALRERDRTGNGTVIDTNITDGAAMLVHSILSAAPRTGGIPVQQLLNGTAPFYRTYKCADGKWFSVGAIEPKFYANLLEHLGLANIEIARKQYDRSHWPEIASIFAVRFAEKSRAEWTALLVDHETCAFPVIEPHELADDPHIAARRTATKENGHVRVARAGRFDDEPATHFGSACAAGANTDEVLQTMGFSAAAIAKLHTEGVIDGPYASDDAE